MGDGAVWIWNLVTQYYPNARQIIDWYHAEEHLEIVAAAAFSDLAQRALWLEECTQALWDGQVEDVIAACKALSQTCLQASKAATYFTNNMERMRYDRFRAVGYMIGSGTVESGCKQIVTQRLKLPGAQWIVTGAGSYRKGTRRLAQRTVAHPLQSTFGFAACYLTTFACTQN